MTPEQIAQRSADTMWASDHASMHVGMEIVSVAPGRAIMTMPVADYMLNGASVCHGGYIFMLADSCFAFACNSYNNTSLAQGCGIEFVRPGMAGDLLTAEALEVTRGRKTGVYDVSVRNQNNKLVAVMRGKSWATGEPHFEIESTDGES